MTSTDLDNLVGPAIFAQAPFPMMVVDRHHLVITANEAFGQAFGPWEGELCHAVLKGRGQPCEGCLSARVFEDGGGLSGEGHDTMGDGRTAHYQEHAVPIHGGEGQVEAVALIALDTTQQHDLARQLRQAERLATVGLTTAGLAHSIKNILGGLEGGVYVVSSGLEQKRFDRVQAGWEMVQAYIEQVTAMVRNLLRYAKAQAPRRELVDPNSLVDDVIQLFESKAALVNIELVGCKDMDLEPILLDRDVMHACLTNLVSNSLDACTWDPDSDKEQRISVTSRENDDGAVVFEVTDSGMGISEENQQKVLSSSFTSKGIRGTGLGLLLTKKAVEEHGGRISFTSTPGVGTTFCIELPEQKSN